MIEHWRKMPAKRQCNVIGDVNFIHNQSIQSESGVLCKLKFTERNELRPLLFTNDFPIKYAAPQSPKLQTECLLWCG